MNVYLCSYNRFKSLGVESYVKICCIFLKQHFTLWNSKQSVSKKTHGVQLLWRQFKAKELGEAKSFKTYQDGFGGNV